MPGTPLLLHIPLCLLSQRIRLSPELYSFLLSHSSYLLKCIYAQCLNGQVSYEYMCFLQELSGLHSSCYLEDSLWMGISWSPLKSGHEAGTFCISGRTVAVAFAPFTKPLVEKCSTFSEVLFGLSLFVQNLCNCQSLVCGHHFNITSL